MESLVNFSQETLETQEYNEGRVHEIGKLYKERLAQQALQELAEFLESSVPQAEKDLQLYNLLVKQAVHNKGVEQELIISRREQTTTQRETNQMYNDLSSEREMKSKLSQVCKELNQQNKMLETRSKQILDDEQKKTVQMRQNFEKTMVDVTAKLEEDAKESDEIHNQNEEQPLYSFVEKMKMLKEQAELRDKQYEQVIMQRDMEVKFSTAQLARKQSTSPEELQSQLNMYKQRFEEFKDTLDKSNSTIDSFRAETKKVRDRIEQLEDENATIRRETDGYDIDLLEVVSQKDDLNKQIIEAAKERDRLKALCTELYNKKKTSSQ